MHHVAWSTWTFGPRGLITPNGCAWTAIELESRAFNRAQNYHDLGGDWSGWRVRGRWLIAPGGQRTAARQVLSWMLCPDWCAVCAQAASMRAEPTQLRLL